MEEKLTLLGCSLLGAEWSCSCPYQRWSLVISDPLCASVSSQEESGGGIMPQYFWASSQDFPGPHWEPEVQTGSVGAKGEKARGNAHYSFPSWRKLPQLLLQDFWPPLSHPGLANTRSSQEVHTDHLGGMGKGIYHNESLGNDKHNSNVRDFCFSIFHVYPIFVLCATYVYFCVPLPLPS